MSLIMASAEQVPTPSSIERAASPADELLRSSQLLLLIQVDMGKNHLGEIAFLRGDTPSLLAYEFCKQHGLHANVSVVKNLTKHIEDSVLYHCAESTAST